MEGEMIRVGIGYDSHRWQEGRRLVLGGVEIPFAKGLLGHSDADALCHAIADAVLGAAGAGDIGTHFPDTDGTWKDASSLKILAGVREIILARGYRVRQVDATVVIERPRLGDYVPLMRENLAQALGVSPSEVSVKAKTNEGMGFIGRGEGVAAVAVVILVPSPS